MKTQIDIDGELWAKFREKVQGEGKTLREVVPTVFEPALRSFIEPPLKVAPPTQQQIEVIQESASVGFPPIIDRLPTPHPTTPPTTVSLRRCELCDKPSEKLFAKDGKRVCYECWKG